MALSITKAECIATGACYAQILWVSQELRDLELDYKKIPIKCYNKSAINIHKNPIQ